MNTKPPCSRKPELWDATNRHEAEQARNICNAACTALDACKRMRANEMQHDFTGTWAGLSYGLDDRTPMSNAERKAATRCQRGHDFTPNNTYIDRKGSRVCRTCIRLNAAERRARAKGDRDVA